MVIAKYVGQLRTNDMAQESLHLQFDFVVTENSVYKSGSGPEVPEPTPMADHDRDGFIISEINNFKGKFTYIVTWEDKPHLLASIRPQKIRDYVSARSYEEWNNKKFMAELERLDTTNKVSSEETGPKIKGKSRKKRKRKKPTRQPKANQNLSVISDLPNPKRQESQEPFSAQQATHASTNTEDLGLSEMIDGVQEKRSTFELNMEVVDQSSDRDSLMNMDQTQPAVVKDGPNSRNDSRLKRLTTNSPIRIIEHYQSLSESSSDINPPRKFRNPILDRLRATRPSTRSLISHSHKNPENFNVNNSEFECSGSSDVSCPGLEVSTVCDAIEKHDKNISNQRQNNKLQNFVDDYFRPEKRPSETCDSPAVSPLQPENQFGSDVEYQVEDIKDEKWEQDKRGNGVLFYLIKWKGSQIYTWEPEENIASDVLAEYTANKLARTNRSRSRSSLFHLNNDVQYNDGGSSYNHDADLELENGEIVNTTKNRKAKQRAMAINMFEPEIPTRRRVGIPGDLGDEDELFQVTPIRRRRSGTRR